MSDFNNGYARPLPQTADMSIDAGLRAFMLGVYNKLALGIAIGEVLGASIGTALGNPGLGIGIGLALGIAFAMAFGYGAGKDDEAD